METGPECREERPGAPRDKWATMTPKLTLYGLTLLCESSMIPQECVGVAVSHYKTAMMPQHSIKSAMMPQCK